MDDRELYWRRRRLTRKKDSPAFYTPDVKGVRTWAANYDPTAPVPDHTGKGPKNYRRPDLRILEDINDALTVTPYVDATEIAIEVHMGVVTLGGHVFERGAKRIAEEIAERVPGVREVRNRIRVGPLLRKRSRQPKRKRTRNTRPPSRKKDRH